MEIFWFSDVDGAGEGVKVAGESLREIVCGDKEIGG